MTKSERRKALAREVDRRWGVKERGNKKKRKRGLPCLRVLQDVSVYVHDDG